MLECPGRRENFEWREYFVQKRDSGVETKAIQNPNQHQRALSKSMDRLEGAELILGK